MIGIGNKYNYIGLDNTLSQAVYSAFSVNFNAQEASADKIAISNIKVRKEETSGHSNNVYFRDPLNNAYVKVGLSDENLNKLQNVFGKDSIKKDEEGNVLLKGEAERFVSGWFGDIAYKRGYVRADANQDGNLDIEERKNTNSFTLGLMGMAKGSNVVFLGNDQTYVKFTELPLGNGERLERMSSSSIEEELNRTIARDGDSDGLIQRVQVWGSRNNYAQHLDKLADYYEKNPGITLPSIDEVFGFLKEMDEDLKEMLKKELEKVGIETKDIRADMSAKEILKKLMENKESTKESLENQELSEEYSTFQQIQDLTKLDKDTLERNLANNPTFEEDIISIVEELVKNVDANYSKSTLDSATRILDVSV
ncbi:hypothetical protein [Helicobacter turcicus]|uniref:Uncharacterized protein n=1 Tax=Helicobacter turcicus TaxID=2867412 RepID=A0ABS7JQ98_9HELI|nr:hypothetical protein [Helicobacter turcicus]MBX7491576.1 hypothetical protein [Helicobacter turcicus]MBX7546425.1 hypothetical protein [Helicobacter turcicus]